MWGFVGDNHRQQRCVAEVFQRLLCDGQSLPHQAFWTSLRLMSTWTRTITSYSTSSIRGCCTAPAYCAQSLGRRKVMKKRWWNTYLTSHTSWRSIRFVPSRALRALLCGRWHDLTLKSCHGRGTWDHLSLLVERRTPPGCWLLLWPDQGPLSCVWISSCSPQHLEEEFDCDTKVCEGKLPVDPGQGRHCLQVEGEMLMMFVRGSQEFCTTPKTHETNSWVLFSMMYLGKNWTHFWTSHCNYH